MKYQGRTLKSAPANLVGIVLSAVSVLLLPSSLLADPASGVAASRPITLADMLKKTDVEAVEVDPSGRRVVFRQSTNDTGDFSLERQSQMLGEIYVYDIASGASPVPLIRTKQGWDGERIVRFSPSGRRVAISWVQQGELKLGVYSFDDERLIQVPITPAFLQFFPLDQTLIWLSDDEFITSALPGAERSGAAVLSRRAAERKLTDLWENAWHGARPTATVLESHAGYPERPPRRGSLVRFNARTERLTTVADGVYFGLRLSPDGRYLAAARQGGWHQPPADRPITNKDFWADYRRYEGVLFDLKEGRGPLSILGGHRVMLSRYTWTWDPQSTRAAFFATEDDKTWEEGSFFVVSAKNRRTAKVAIADLQIPLTRELRDYRYEQAVPFQTGIAVPAQLKPKADQAGRPARIDWYAIAADGTHRNLTERFSSVSPRLVAARAGALYILADGKLWRISGDSEPRSISDSVGTPIAQFSNAKITFSTTSSGQEPDQALVYTTDFKKIVALDFDGSIKSVVPMPEGILQMHAVAPATGVAVVERRPESIPTLTLVQRDGKLLPIMPFNAHLTGTAQPTRVSVSYKLPDGAQFSTGLLLPIGWTQGKRLPLIVEIYPGVEFPSGVDGPLSAGLFTTMGYAVMAPNAPQERLGNAAGALSNWVNLVMPAIDVAVAAGYVDPDRIAVTGASAGGWSTLALITQTQRFKAAIAEFSTGNFIEYTYGGYAGGSYLLSQLYPEESHPAVPVFEKPSGEIRGAAPFFDEFPWEDPTAYIKASPFFSAGRITTPVMLVQSDLDGGSLDHLTQMFRAMYRLRREAQLVTYWGEAHGLSSPANIRDSWARRLAWVDRWCDILRNADGEVVYDSDSPRSREARPALRSEDFLKWSWFFGADASRMSLRDR